MVEAGNACSDWEAGWTGELRVSAGADGDVAGGGGVLCDAGDSAVAGFMGTESNSVGWLRDAFSRAT